MLVRLLLAPLLDLMVDTTLLRWRLMAPRGYTTRMNAAVMTPHTAGQDNVSDKRPQSYIGVAPHPAHLARAPLVNYLCAGVGTG